VFVCDLPLANEFGGAPYAVAAHLRFASIGVQHAHAQNAVGVSNDQDQTVAAYPRSPVVDRDRQLRRSSFGAGVVTPSITMKSFPIPCIFVKRIAFKSAPRRAPCRPAGDMPPQPRQAESQERRACKLTAPAFRAIRIEC